MNTLLFIYVITAIATYFMTLKDEHKRKSAFHNPSGRDHLKASAIAAVTGIFWPLLVLVVFLMIPSIVLHRYWG